MSGRDNRMYQILFLVAILLVIESTIRCIVVSASALHSSIVPVTR